MPTLSVIIPTHRRATILRQCLRHLEKQSIAKDLEVIVVSDGHDDDTAALFTKDQSWGIPITFLEIEKSQQGVARNRGVDAAKSDLVLFIGDDAFLQPHACEAHLRAHEHLTLKHPKSAVLGFTTWDPMLPINRTMRWLERSGWQFGYPFLEPYRRSFIPAEMQHRFSYTIHLSLPHTLAQKHRFREDVTLYGWEDTEWGLRLAQDDVGLWYEPTGVALHHHAMTLEGSLRRMETLGQSAVAIARVNPALDPRPRGWKRTAYKILSILPTLRGMHSRAFLRGIASGAVIDKI